RHPRGVVRRLRRSSRRAAVSSEHELGAARTSGSATRSDAESSSFPHRARLSRRRRAYRRSVALAVADAGPSEEVLLPGFSHAPHRSTQAMRSNPQPLEPTTSCYLSLLLVEHAGI